ncbi:hypothetical protein DLM78_17870 [Leptospira stimsonii]|uniref:Uncharacterized protein n=1 Tax=Leptospira stimsonii TaxID=2202203 RepID=A0A8B3CQG3_9LEPT|nr:hypothetical protein DLM78_17870 [Leptospira stimsonii]
MQVVYGKKAAARRLFFIPSHFLNTTKIESDFRPTNDIHQSPIFKNEMLRLVVTQEKNDSFFWFTTITASFENEFFLCPVLN